MSAAGATRSLDGAGRPPTGQLPRYGHSLLEDARAEIRNLWELYIFHFHASTSFCWCSVYSVLNACIVRTIFCPKSILSCFLWQWERDRVSEKPHGAAPGRRSAVARRAEDEGGAVWRETPGRETTADLQPQVNPRHFVLLCLSLIHSWSPLNVLSDIWLGVLSLLV